jgi:dTDP-4-dehydrorhamnose 3,5-epimerase
MRFLDTEIDGLWLIVPEPHTDTRGSFARTFCVREFGDNGLATDFVQHSLSRSHARYTLRGLHFQLEPHGETKLVGCASGALWDVAVDLRLGSPTRGRWFGAELSADNGHQLYIPAGFAHGFMTLSDETVTRYLISAYYTPDAARGLRYDDPDLAIDWPATPACVADKDLAWPRFTSLVH